MILLTCPRCHKADDDCQCWPLVNKGSLRAQLEARFGIPFGDLMQRFAELPVSRKDTAALLNVSYPALLKLLQRHGDPFEPQDAALRYLRKHGEPLVTAATRLASTHTLHQSADVLGVSGSALKAAFEARAIPLPFVKRYGAGRKVRNRSERWSRYHVLGAKGSLRELAERFASVPLKTVRNRVHSKGWSVTRALTTPNIEDENRRRNARRMWHTTRQLFLSKS